MYLSERMPEKNNFRGYIVLNLLQTKTTTTATMSASESINSLSSASEEEEESSSTNSENTEKPSTILRVNLRESTINNIHMHSFGNTKYDTARNRIYDFVQHAQNVIICTKN